MKLLQFILLFILSFSVHAAKIEDDTIKVGKPGSTADKYFIFRDANNTQLGVTHTNGYGFLNSNKFILGNGVDSDTTFEFNIGLGANNPKIFWDLTKQKFRQQISGTDKDLGTGGGSGGGENFNNAFTSDQNANAEDGTTGWTASAGELYVTGSVDSWVTAISYSIGDNVVESGTIYKANTAHTSSAMFSTDIANWDIQIGSDSLEGDQSFVWTPAAQNDTLDSAVLDVDKDIFKGRSCEARIEYIGGDLNLDLLVVDGNGTILNPLNGTASTEGNNRSLPPHTISSSESISFLCPSAADIAGDSLKGDIKFQLKNVGVSAAALIKFDKSYLGTLQALSEVTLPDEFSALIAGSGTITQDNSGGVISGGSSCGVGCITVNFSGLTVAPICTATTDSSTSGGSVIGFRGSTSLNIYTQIGGTLTDLPAYLKCSKAGADAKQSVQVYKSIPKVSENVNTFSAYVASTGAVQFESVDWINGSCTNTANLITCPYNNLNLTTQMSCTVTSVGFNDATTLDAKIVAPSSSTTQVGFVVENGSATTSSDVMIVCHKNSADFKMPILQPIIVGQVANSYADSVSKNVRVESCLVSNSGTPSSASYLCDSWVDSYTDGGVGNIQLNIKAGIFSGRPVCATSVYSPSFTTTTNYTQNSLTIGTQTVSTSDGSTPQDRDFNIICMEKK